VDRPSAAVGIRRSLPGRRLQAQLDAGRQPDTKVSTRMRRSPGWMYESYDEDGPLWTPDEMRQALLTVFAGQPSARKLADDFAELDPASPGGWDELMLLAVAWTFPERAARIGRQLGYSPAELEARLRAFAADLPWQLPEE
jgi:hypothetical protein